MCFGGGGGKSADDYYKEMKPEFGPLPSLTSEGVDRKQPKMGDVKKPVQRTGSKRRSLLMYGGE